MSRKKRVLYIVPNVSGLKRFFETGELVDEGMPAMFYPIRQLLSGGFDITFFVYPYYNQISLSGTRKFDRFSICYLELPPERNLFRIVRGFSGGLIQLHPLIEIFSMARQIKNLNVLFASDVIYAHDTLGTLVGLLLKKQYGKRLISRMYGASFMRRSRGRISFLNKVRYWDKYLPLKLSSDHLIITKDGSISKQQLSKIEPLSLKTSLCYNGYEPPAESQEKDSRLFDGSLNLISISNFAKWKNDSFLLDLFKELLEYVPGSSLKLVGDGPEFQELKRKCLRLGLESNVQFVGRIPRERINQELLSADVFMSCYDCQNLSNTLWEAMSVEKCVFLRREYALNHEIIQHGKNGYLFSIDEPGEAVRCLVELSKDVEKLRAVGKNARCTLESRLMTWEQRAKREVAAIEGILENA